MSVTLEIIFVGFIWLDFGHKVLGIHRSRILYVAEDDLELLTVLIRKTIP